MMTPRPTIGQILTIPAQRTRFSPVPGCPVPLGHHVGEDGRIWTNPQELTVRTVRKARGLDAWDVGGTVNGGRTGRSLRLSSGWTATHLSN